MLFVNFVSMNKIKGSQSISFVRSPWKLMTTKKKTVTKRLK